MTKANESGGARRAGPLLGHSVRVVPSEMAFPSSLVWSALFAFLIASPCETTSVVTCMLCTVITEPLEKEMSPTATVNAMFKKCDKMGLMEPVCAQFVSENVKDVFQRVRQGTPPATVCQSMRFCDLQ